MNQESVAALMRAAAPVIAGFVAQEVAKATAPLLARIDELESRPMPEKGEKGDKGDPGEPGQDGLNGRDGIDGKDGAPGVDGKDGIDGAPGSDGKDGRAGADGKDGTGLADAFLAVDGNLVLTMTDGRAIPLGCVAGKDGAPGADGKDGAPGRDGISPEDFKAELKEDGRTLVIRLGELEPSEVVFPVVLYEGVWKEGKFKKGDAVTWGGSLFVAQCDTEEKPEQSKDWRLAVKRGRDGKDGKDGNQGERGPQGIPGKDWQGNRG